MRFTKIKVDKDKKDKIQIMLGNVFKFTKKQIGVKTKFGRRKYLHTPLGAHRLTKLAGNIT